MKKLIKLIAMITMTMMLCVVAATAQTATQQTEQTTTTKVVNLNDLAMLNLLSAKGKQKQELEMKMFGLKKYYGNVEWSKDRTAQLATNDKEAKKLLNARFGTNFYRVVGDVEEWKFITSNNEQVVKDYDKYIRKALLSRDYSEVRKSSEDGLYYVRTVINGETVYQKAFK